MKYGIYFAVVGFLSACPLFCSADHNQIDELTVVGDQIPTTNENDVNLNEQEAALDNQQLELDEANQDQLFEGIWDTIKGAAGKVSETLKGAAGKVSTVVGSIKEKITGGGSKKTPPVIPEKPLGATKMPGPATEKVSCPILKKTYGSLKNFLLSYVKPGEFAGDNRRPSYEKLPKPMVDVTQGSTCFE